MSSSFLPQGMVDPDFDLPYLYADHLAEFTDTLISERIWNIVNADGKKQSVFDAGTGLRFFEIDELVSFFNAHPFLYLRRQGRKGYEATLHTSTGLLWVCASKDLVRLNTGKDLAAKSEAAGLKGWRIPTKGELKAFVTTSANPYRSGSSNRLLGQYAWLCTAGKCDIDNWNIYSSSEGALFVCHDFWQGAITKEVISMLGQSGWEFFTPDGKSRLTVTPDDSWKSFDPTGVMESLRNNRLHLVSQNGKKQLLPDPFSSFIDLDYTPCRLPKIEPVRLTDPNKGLWELWGNPTEILKRFGLVARDPKRDIHNHNVAIDFGTSSTVVAITDEHGDRKLLRIGVRDFYQTPRAADFENPTVLEFIDFDQFWKAWTSKAYRPFLDWSWIHAAHEARASFRDNPGDTAVLASILPLLKQWALRSEKEEVKITDRKGLEITLPVLAERNPVRGTPLEVSSTDPFDPIELYAWFLGMVINWRGRGIYLKYHLTFPVKYPRTVKDKILSSFRRGLQRSLPLTLVKQPELLDSFEVKEIASEPAAYAAAALRQLGLEPGDRGIPYGVFDFGGGTSDFDFGLWRQPTAEEEEEGYYYVVEHLHSSGDNFLGGENLLEHLVYATFRDNLDVCRENKIHFTRPIDGKDFTGEEAFVDRTRIAQTNSVLLAARLRPFLESEDGNLESHQLRIDLLDIHGQKKTCELSLNRDSLEKLLFERIERGVRAFLGELREVCGLYNLPDNEPIHFLLAGNGSRSRHIRKLCNTKGEDWKRLLQEIFGDTPPNLVVHDPLPMDESNHHAPTAKTGVALGLLALCPGEGVKLIDRVRTASHDEAPFRYFVGKIARGDKFEIVLGAGATYGQWVSVGKLQQGVFRLAFTLSTRAKTGMIKGDTELHVERIDFPAAQIGDQLFVRPVGTDSIELSAAPDEESLNGESIPRRTLDLETKQ